MGKLFDFKKSLFIDVVFYELARWMQGFPSAMLAGKLGFPYII